MIHYEYINAPNLFRFSATQSPCIFSKSGMVANGLQLLVFQLGLKFLRFGHLPHSLVEIILVYGVPVILDGGQSPIELELHLD